MPSCAIAAALLVAAQSDLEERFVEAAPGSRALERAARALARDRAQGAVNLLADADTLAVSYSYTVNASVSDLNFDFEERDFPDGWRREQARDRSWFLLVRPPPEEASGATLQLFPRRCATDGPHPTVAYLKLRVHADPDPRDTALALAITQPSQDLPPDRVISLLLMEDQYHDPQGARHPNPPAPGRTLVRTDLAAGRTLPDWYATGTRLPSIFSDGLPHDIEFVSHASRTAILIDGNLVNSLEAPIEHFDRAQTYEDLGMLVLSNFSGQILELLEAHNP